MNKMNLNKLTAYQLIDAMRIGLRTLPNPSMKVDMTTFGAIETKEVCAGCAATFTLQKLLDVRLDLFTMPYKRKRAKAYNMSEENMRALEMVVDYFRKGEFTELLNYFNLPHLEGEGTWLLESDDYQFELEKVDEWMEVYKEVLSIDHRSLNFKRIKYWLKRS